MAIKNKTVEIQIQEARLEGYENALGFKDSVDSYNTGREITKALYQLRQQIADEIMAQVKDPLEPWAAAYAAAAAIARGK